jgi:hypothetical protein
MFSITFTKYPPILICKIEFFSSSSANLHRCTIRKALPQQPPSYSEEYVKNMTRLHQALRNNPKTLIQLVKGPDQLCEKYPNSGEYHCQDIHIYERDAAILEKLGLKIGQILHWEDIESCI